MHFSIHMCKTLLTIQYTCILWLVCFFLMGVHHDYSLCAILPRVHRPRVLYILVLLAFKPSRPLRGLEGLQVGFMKGLFQSYVLAAYPN